jgi:PIN domain nuclease of toxin-antitoxin system
MERGRLMLASGAQSFLDQLNMRFAVLPINSDIAVAAARIAVPFHGDPIDRMIVATALATKSTLITADRSILASNACRLVW